MISGEYTDYWQYPNGELVLAGEGKNLIVSGMHVVIAANLKQAAGNAGFMYWAVGDGNTGGAGSSAAWDAAVLAGTTAPAVTDTGLLREIYRKAVGPSDITYIDATGATSGTPTNRLQITCTFLESEPSAVGDFYFREFGLYGLNATITAGSGTLMNHRLHATYDKNVVARLIRNLRVLL